MKFLKKVFLITFVSLLILSCKQNPDIGKEKIDPADSVLKSLSSVDFAKNFSNGWNLGNTLDANTVESNSYNIGLSAETLWGMPETSKKLIQAVKEAGFNSIRIPVSWHNHISNVTDVKIDSEWMERVKQIVDWACDEKLYVILNVHHDNLSESEMNNNLGFCISEKTALQEKSKNYLSKIWSQIATEFKDYNYGLVFEILNEPRNKGSENEWTPGDKAASYNTIITSYEQTCLDAIRATGGNNADRFLMCPGYAASPWYLDSFSFPKDTVPDKLILSVHAYDPYDFAMGDDNTFTASHKSSLDALFNKLSSTYTSKGIGVVMGEFSASDKDNDDERIKWVEYYCSKAKNAEVACVLWDNMVVYPNGTNQAERHGYLDRKNLTWYFTDFINVVVK